MKKHIFALLLAPSILLTSCNGQKNPEQIQTATSNSSNSTIKNNTYAAVEVPIILKERFPYEFYLEQAKLWKNEVNQYPTDDFAWYNLYKANRYCKLTYSFLHSPEMSWHKNTEWINEADYLMDENEIKEQLIATNPESFMRYYVTYSTMMDVDTDESFPVLEKAYSLNPNFFEIYDEFVIHHEIKGETELRKQYNKKWFESNDFSEGMLNYFYNVLHTLKEDAILLSFGDNDFLAPLMLQDAKEVRTDVFVVSAPLMVTNLTYRKNILNRLNIKNFDTEFEDGFSYENMRAMVDYILNNKSDKNTLYYSLLTPEKLKENYLDKLYLVGVALEYSEENIDNMAQLKKNFESKYLLDYVTMSFTNDKYKQAYTLSESYIYGLANLYKHYKESGESKKAENVKTLALKIVERVDNKEGAQHTIDFFED